jgi:hypothetical protein
MGGSPCGDHGASGRHTGPINTTLFPNGEAVMILDLFTILGRVGPRQPLNNRLHNFLLVHRGWHDKGEVQQSIIGLSHTPTRTENKQQTIQALFEGVLDLSHAVHAHWQVIQQNLFAQAIPEKIKKSILLLNQNNT